MQANFTILRKKLVFWANRELFSCSHKHSTKSVEYCSTWKYARRFLGAHTHRKKHS